MGFESPNLNTNESGQEEYGKDKLRREIKRDKIKVVVGAAALTAAGVIGMNQIGKHIQEKEDAAWTRYNITIIDQFNPGVFQNIAPNKDGSYTAVLNNGEIFKLTDEQLFQMKKDSQAYEDANRTGENQSGNFAGNPDLIGWIQQNGLRIDENPKDINESINESWNLAKLHQDILKELNPGVFKNIEYQGDGKYSLELSDNDKSFRLSSEQMSQVLMLARKGEFDGKPENLINWIEQNSHQIEKGK